MITTIFRIGIFFRRDRNNSVKEGIKGLQMELCNFILEKMWHNVSIW
jgi:hypothetical protein